MSLAYLVTASSLPLSCHTVVHSHQITEMPWTENGLKKYTKKKFNYPKASNSQNSWLQRLLPVSGKLMVCQPMTSQLRMVSLWLLVSDGLSILILKCKPTSGWRECTRISLSLMLRTLTTWRRLRSVFKRVTLFFFRMLVKPWTQLLITCWTNPLLHMDVA